MTPHVDVGAYLLGALDEAEMAAFEEHLAGCEECGGQLDELSGVLPVLEELRSDPGAGTGDGAGAGAAGLAGAAASGGGGAGAGSGGGTDELRLAGLAGPPSGDALLDRLLAQVAAERGGRRRRRLVSVAAAAVLVVGGPAVAVLATQDGGGPPAATANTAFATDRHSATNPGTGASAVVGVADKVWGSMVDLKLTGVRGPLTCSLVAVGRDGSRQTVATWSVPDTGYGTHAQPAPLTVHGAAGLHEDLIARFDVQVLDGPVLVSVPT